MSDKTAWANCKTYGIQWFDPIDPETYPKLCDDDECMACFGAKLWDEYQEKAQKDFLEQLIFGEDDDKKRASPDGEAI